MTHDKQDILERIEGCIANAEHEDEGETLADARDLIEQQAAEIARLKREKAVVDDLLEQQQDLALQYLTDCNEAVARIAKLEAALERMTVQLEDIASLTGNPLSNPLEVGFRQSPLTPLEREKRYMEACALAWQSAQHGIEARAALEQEQ